MFGSIPSTEMTLPLLVMCRSVRQTCYFIYCLCPPSSDGYLVEQKNWKIVNGISCRKCAEFSPEEMRPYKRERERESSNTRGIIVKSADLMGISDYKPSTFTFMFLTPHSTVWGHFDPDDHFHAQHKNHQHHSSEILRLCQAIY